MKKLIYVLILMIIFAYSVMVEAKKYEGEVIKVDLKENALVIKQSDGQEIPLRVREDARLYYNNTTADLGMYAPITESDFISGYLETDDDGMVKEANFYYLLREGTIQELGQDILVLRDTECSICDNYQLSTDTQVFLNNFSSNLEKIKPGMRALIILDYKFQVKKIAAYHYDYIGFIQTINLNTHTVVLNVGSRLNPIFREFSFKDSVSRPVDGWESLIEKLHSNRMLFAKVMVAEEENLVTFIDIRSL